MVASLLRHIFLSNASSSAGAPVDEDQFEKQMRLSYESQVRVSTVQRYGKSQTLDQLEEWMREKPIPYISNDKFSQEDIFHYWAGWISFGCLSIKRYQLRVLSTNY